MIFLPLSAIAVPTLINVRIAEASHVPDAVLHRTVRFSRVRVRVRHFTLRRIQHPQVCILPVVHRGTVLACSAVWYFWT